MGSISVNKLGALSLIIGPVLALVFFSLQPGSLLIESAEPSNPVESIRAFASNAALTNVTGLAVALGLVMTTVGLYVLQSGVRDGGTGDALSRAGLILIVFGNVGWVLAQGLTLALADAQGPQTVQTMVPVYTVRSGIVTMSGTAIALGFILFSVALSTKDGFNKTAARIVALASLVAMVSFIVAVSSTSMYDTGISVARVCYLAWTVWPIMLGLGLLKSGASGTAED